MWQPMTLDEFAELEGNTGEKLVKRNGVWYRCVRFAFHRTVFPFLIVSDEQAPNVHIFKCFQYAVADKDKANSFLNCIVYDNQPDYAVEKLSKHHRRYLRAALRADLELKVFHNPDELLHDGHCVYQSFMERAQYKYGRERCQKEAFELWIRNVMENPKVMVHGVRTCNELIAIYISCRIADTIYWKAAINSMSAIQMRTPELILHTYREAASKLPDIKQIYCGMLSSEHNQNTFKIRRGARITAIPAYHNGPLLMRMLCKLLTPSSNKRLIGYSPDEVVALTENYKSGKCQ